MAENAALQLIKLNLLDFAAPSLRSRSRDATKLAKPKRLVAVASLKLRWEDTERRSDLVISEEVFDRN
jgi:hypothetical protein